MRVVHSGTDGVFSLYRVRVAGFGALVSSARYLSTFRVQSVVCFMSARPSGVESRV